MPITKITLENVKGISERTEVELKPITVLFGANSAGKSTLLQAMLYLREIWVRQPPSTLGLIRPSKNKLSMFWEIWA